MPILSVSSLWGVLVGVLMTAAAQPAAIQNNKPRKGLLTYRWANRGRGVSDLFSVNHNT